ncbi:hypothetical protein [Dorea formicigenerans]|uniref:Uncharacterized protein n=1 Tax=Dorea formicigenerans TaxID=39486 RepID=A0A412ME94_9FIRM|nr:hypothetical protein [Dorea formicigenerans]RGT09575.1 hypothetical protein DWX53_07785 [Dorea formicigenerans]RHE28207.1 hypothetical protein DW756_07375 [Dorea formicigenerans]
MDKVLLYKVLAKNGAEKSASGNPVVLTDTVEGKSLKDLKLYGWSKQERTTGAQLFPTITPSIEEKNGITVEYMEHGKIHISGTAEKTVDFMTPTFELLAGTYTLSMGVNINNTLMRCTLSTTEGLPYFNILDNGASKTETIGDNKILYLLLRVYGGKTINITVQPMLNTGTSPLPWEPYTGGQPSPSPDYPQEIVSAGMKWSTGAQLYDMDTRLNVDGIEYKKNGTSYTVNIVKMSGNLLYGVPFQFSKEDVYATLSVSQFFNLEQAGVRINLMDSESNIVGTLWADKAEKELSAKCSKIRFDWSRGGKFIVSDLMLNFGNTALPYEPYTDGVPKLYGDKVNVEVCGKNWLHVTPFRTKFQNGVTFEYVKPGGIKVTGTATTNTDSPVFPIELEPGDYYTDRTTVKQAVVVERNGKRTWISGKKFKILQNDVPKYWYFPILQGDTVNATIYPRIYKKEETPRSLSISTPTGLPAIPVDTDGNYTDANGQQWIADYVDLKREKYVQNICDLPLKDISLEWNTWGVNVNASNSTGFFAYVKKYAHVGNTKALATICRHHTDAWGGRKVGCSANVNNSYITISLYTSDLDDASDNKKAIESFKKIVEQTDTHVLYVRAEPIERDLTPEEIQAYKNLVTYAGTTIVENDAECYMEVSAGGGDGLRAKKLALILGE